MWDAFTSETVPQIVYLLITCTVTVRYRMAHHDVVRAITDDVMRHQIVLSMRFLAAV